jgi:glycolate oxidase FAD binding subunit
LVGTVTLLPESVAELQEILRSGVPFRIIGTGSKNEFRIPLSAPANALSTKNLSGIVEHDVADQVVVVRAGTHLYELQTALLACNQYLPFPHPSIVAPPAAGWPVTVGGTISMNLPHAYEHQCGSWRDWVLGLTVVLADGTFVRCGSKAVKNVAGYDLMKLFVGARGSLGVITEVILRTFPHSEPRYDLSYAKGTDAGAPFWIQRVQRQDFDKAVEGTRGRPTWADWISCTLWTTADASEDLPRYPGDWVIRSGCGEKNVQITDPTQIRLMKRAKQIFDPTNKLNPGEWGFM